MTIELPKMLSIRQAMQQTGLTYAYLRGLCLQEKIAFVRSGTKYYINAQSLSAYLERGTM